MSTTTDPAPGRTRRNRGSEVVRDALLGAAIVEFSAHGFEGASTRRIAEAAGAHQSQIKYHFDSKDELWKRCLEQLIGELDLAVADELADRSGRLAIAEAIVRGIVRFGAQRPELNRIMMHEATTPSERLEWLVETHLSRRRSAMTAQWLALAEEGLVAPIDPELLYHSLIGAASLLYANSPEAHLMGIDTADRDLVDRHADALVAMFVPTAEGAPS